MLREKIDGRTMSRVSLEDLARCSRRTSSFDDDAKCTVAAGMVSKLIGCQTQLSFRPPVGKERSGTPGEHHKRLNRRPTAAENLENRKGQKRPAQDHASDRRIGFAK